MLIFVEEHEKEIKSIVLTPILNQHSRWNSNHFNNKK